MYGILILLDMFKRYPRFGLFHSQSTRMKKSKTKQNKNYISKEKTEVLFHNERLQKNNLHQKLRLPEVNLLIKGGSVKIVNCHFFLGGGGGNHFCCK